MKNNKGFTLIELLVVIAIIGLLSTLAVVALGNARVKARDSKRMSDLKQIQTALELYYTDRNVYPAGTNLQLGAAATKCLNNSDAGFVAAGATCGDQPYMGNVPDDPQSAAGAHYVYNAGAASSTYTVTAHLEDTVNGLTGNIQLTPSGISAAP